METPEDVKAQFIRMTFPEATAEDVQELLDLYEKAGDVREGLPKDGTPEADALAAIGRKAFELMGVR